jgi:hypothetical protein
MAREHLLGYLLGALEEDERRQFARALDDDPGLQFELRRVEARLELLGPPDEHFEPPVGLAARTSQAVAHRALCVRPSPREAQSRETRSSWRVSLADLVVAAGVITAAALLFFPAILNSRYQSELAFCQNNLRRLAVALSNYADASDGYFPRVPTQGNRAIAGVYAPLLTENGWLDDPRAVICPSSELAQQPGFRIPTLGELDRAEDEKLAQIQSLIGGSYGFNLGYLEGGVHSAAKHLGRPTFAIMADAPSEHLRQRISANHGGRGQNVLFDDLHVDFLIDCKAEGCRDAVYLNHHGDAEAGVNRDDAVVGSSATAPLLRAVSFGR